MQFSREFFLTSCKVLYGEKKRKEKRNQLHYPLQYNYSLIILRKFILISPHTLTDIFVRLTKHNFLNGVFFKFHLSVVKSDNFHIILPILLLEFICKTLRRYDYDFVPPLKIIALQTGPDLQHFENLVFTIPAVPV